MNAKSCSKCGEVKPLDEFSISRGNPRSYCKCCGVLYSKQWESKNKNRASKTKRRYYLKNKSFCYAKHKQRRQCVADSYCVEILRQKRGFQTEQITPELIGVQRNVIKIKRLAKEIEA